MIGGAYAVTEAFSASIGLRYINAVNTMKTGFTLTDPLLILPDLPLALDGKDKASGLGWVLGVHIAATPRLDLSAHYESKVKLDFETTVNQDDIGLGTPGAKSRRDLPAALYLGAGYRWTPRLQMLVDFNYWFQTAADWDTTTVNEVETNWADLAGDCYAAGIGFAYELNDRLKLSAGTVFTNFLFKDRDQYFSRVGEVEAPKGDNWNCGIGLAYKACARMTLNLALGGTFWKKQTIASEFVFPYTVEVKAYAYSISVGLNLDL
jgi:long-subunit fatty acid transport protein